MKTVVALIGAVMLALPAFAIGAASDPFLGTWRLSKARSTIADDPGVKSKEFVFSPTNEFKPVFSPTDWARSSRASRSRCRTASATSPRPR